MAPDDPLQRPDSASIKPGPPGVEDDPMDTLDTIPETAWYVVLVLVLVVRYRHLRARFGSVSIEGD